MDLTARSDSEGNQGNSKPESLRDFRSNVSVRDQPALVQRAAMTASANEPFPCLSAIMAVKTFLLLLYNQYVGLEDALNSRGDLASCETVGTVRPTRSLHRNNAHKTRGFLG